MTEYISSLKGVALRDSRFIFILSKEKEDRTDIQRPLNQFAGKIGDSMGASGRVIRATSTGSAKVFMDLAQKGWPESVRTRMDNTQDPFLTIIDSDFDDFDPAKGGWQIIWFESTRSPRDRIRNLLEVLCDSIVRGTDIFSFFDDLPVTSPGITVYGEISSPRNSESRTGKRPKGRPGIFLQEYGVTEWIDEQIRSQRFTSYARGWKLEVANQLLSEKPCLSAVVSSPKAIVDAFGRQKDVHGRSVFDRIEAAASDQS
jgi:hypothetical protein